MKVEKTIVIVIPALNPSDGLLGLAESLTANGCADPVLIVDDGSDDRFRPVFDAAAALSGVEVIRHEKNRGKGAALKTAIRYVEETYGDGLLGIVTADADGQHLRDDIRRVTEFGRLHENDFVMGVRDFSGGVPFRSRFGNQLTLFVLSMLYGIRLVDSQTGLRYLPASILRHLEELPGDRYEFELECILEARKHDYVIVEVPISTVYIDRNASSHFKPLRDSVRIYRVFFRFSISSLLCAGIDIVLFSVLLALTGQAMLATLVARVVSGIANFSINKLMVFNAATSHQLLAEAGKYFLLWLALALASGAFVSAFEDMSPFALVPLKVMADTALFLLSFVVQRSFVFLRSR